MGRELLYSIYDRLVGVDASGNLINRGQEVQRIVTPAKTTSARIGGGYNALFFIEIDTTSMSSGSLYLDDFAYTPG